MLTAEGLDVSAALDWAARKVGSITSVRELTGGWTSTMLALSTESGEDVVLRLMTRQPWRTHGPGLTTRESEIQLMLEGSPVPAPSSRALDAEGSECGVPAHLMSRVPGGVDVDRVDPVSLGRLAEVLVAIHDVQPTIEVRPYESWAWEAKYVVPPWASDPAVWEEAFAVLRDDVPDHEACFIHRDFQPRNVLWSGDRISGVVDWVETSIGPAWLDVAHCSTNIALRHGHVAAEAFAAAYVDRSGRTPEPYFDVMDIVGFLPPPGRKEFVTAQDEQSRLEERLRVVLRQHGLTA